MSAIANMFRIPELTRRLAWTLGLLAVYRAGVGISLPGVNRRSLHEALGAAGNNTFLQTLSLLTGGALEQASIFALGIMPYVTASIIMQLMSFVVPNLSELRKEGEAGQRKINQYTRYLTIGIALPQAYFVATKIVSYNTASAAGDVVRIADFNFYFMAIVTLITGTAFIMWLGEQITERGIGNGSSLIIFGGIVADLPGAFKNTFESVKNGQINAVALMTVTIIIVLVIAAIVFFERGQRRIPVHYARRMIGRKLYGGQMQHLPLKVNTAGVVPPIFASSVLLFPEWLSGLVPQLSGFAGVLNGGGWQYNALFVLLIVFFAYFYTSIMFQPVEVAENLKKQSAFIPGIRPGRATAEYIERVLMRITAAGALYMAAVCLLPQILQTKFHVPFVFGGTSVMIVVGVALDTVQQIESYLIQHQYEGFAGARGPRIRGRRG